MLLMNCTEPSFVVDGGVRELVAAGLKVLQLAKKQRTTDAMGMIVFNIFSTQIGPEENFTLNTVKGSFVTFAPLGYPRRADISCFCSEGLIFFNPESQNRTLAWANIAIFLPKWRGREAGFWSAKDFSIFVHLTVQSVKNLKLPLCN